MEVLLGHVAVTPAGREGKGESSALAGLVHILDKVALRAPLAEGTNLTWEELQTRRQEAKAKGKGRDGHAPIMFAQDGGSGSRSR